MNALRMLLASALCAAVVFGAIGRAGAAPLPDGVGLLEDCSTAEGWYELDKAGQKIPPRVRKMESKDGLLYIHTNRARLRVARKYGWVAPGADWLTHLFKDFGEVDLDKYRYLVVNIKAKGSAVFFCINGFTSKAGYTTGVTAIDLKDYDDDRIRGTQQVQLELDLHDNMTTFVLDEVKLVSELTAHERTKLIGRGLTIRQEHLTAKENHGLAELARRAKVPPPNLDREEMVVFRDTATGAISTRLTANGGNDYFGEGQCWSADGAAIRYQAKGRGLQGVPVYLLDDGSVTSAGSGWRAQWSPAEPTKLFVVSRKGKMFSVTSWDRSTGQTDSIVSFEGPSTRKYTEVKRFTAKGKLIIAFRETPHMYVVDTINKTVRHIELSTRLKDASMSSDEKFVTWANCYTYERPWRNLETGEEGLSGSFSAGHGCGSVRSFGPYLKLLPTESVSRDRTPGDKIQIWANWQNRIITDYGSFTSDRKWIFTNGTRGDVKRQHMMVPSADSGAVLRIARYFTKFSWESTTYSRPSPDYTKVLYNENCFGPTQLVMVYTRRTDPPENVALAGNRLSWTPPARAREIKGYDVYASKVSGRDFAKINDELIAGSSYDLPETSGFYVVTSVEHSRLESMFSAEVTTNAAHTYYYEAERQKLTPPARRFFDGYCNDFQSVRINAESPPEQARDGLVTISTENAAAGAYTVWALAKGSGTWTVAGKATAIGADNWQWVKLADGFNPAAGKLEISSGDDVLMLDTVMITTEDFVPASADPRDSTGPAAVTGLAATADGATKGVTLTWDQSKTPDLHHYSVYYGQDEDFACDNATVIRSVYKNSITDAGMAEGPAYYKVVAYDSRQNASQPATIKAALAE